MSPTFRSQAVHALGGDDAAFAAVANWVIFSLRAMLRGLRKDPLSFVVFFVHESSPMFVSARDRDGIEVGQGFRCNTLARSDVSAWVEAIPSNHVAAVIAIGDGTRTIGFPMTELFDSHAVASA